MMKPTARVKKTKVITISTSPNKNYRLRLTVSSGKGRSQTPIASKLRTSNNVLTREKKIMRDIFNEIIKQEYMAPSSWKHSGCNETRPTETVSMNSRACLTHASSNSDSMECCCYLRDVQDLLADGKTPYERRFGRIFQRCLLNPCNVVAQWSHHSLLQ